MASGGFVQCCTKCCTSLPVAEASGRDPDPCGAGIENSTLPKFLAAKATKEQHKNKNLEAGCRIQARQRGDFKVPNKKHQSQITGQKSDGHKKHSKDGFYTSAPDSPRKEGSEAGEGPGGETV